MLYLLHHIEFSYLLPKWSREIKAPRTINIFYKFSESLVSIYVFSVSCIICSLFRSSFNHRLFLKFMTSFYSFWRTFNIELFKFNIELLIYFCKDWWFKYLKFSPADDKAIYPVNPPKVTFTSYFFNNLSHVMFNYSSD